MAEALLEGARWLRVGLGPFNAEPAAGLVPPHVGTRQRYERTTLSRPSREKGVTPATVRIQTKESPSAAPWRALLPSHRGHPIRSTGFSGPYGADRAILAGDCAWWANFPALAAISSPS